MDEFKVPVFLCTIRSLIASAIYPFFLMFCAVFVIGFGLLEKIAWQDKSIQFWVKWTMKLYGVRCHGYHLEKVPAGGCLLVFNHTSHFDIVAIQSLVPRTRFGAKIELFSIPVFGLAMRASRCLPIARANLKKVITVYQEAEARARAGQCFALAPEGTRQERDELGPFKSGPFIFAINAGVPLIPVYVVGAHEVMPKNSYLPMLKDWTKEIRVYFGDPISTVGFSVANRSELQEKLRLVMESMRRLD